MCTHQLGGITEPYSVLCTIDAGQVPARQISGAAARSTTAESRRTSSYSLHPAAVCDETRARIFRLCPDRRGLPTDGNKKELVERATVLIEESAATAQPSALNGAGLGASPTKVTRGLSGYHTLPWRIAYLCRQSSTCKFGNLHRGC